MRSVAFTLFVVALSHFTAIQAATRKVTLLVNFEKPHSAASVVALQKELADLMQPAGVSIDVMLRSEMPESPEFAELVVFQMKGSCSMNVAPPFDELVDERGPLAKAYSSDGQILHFGEVECDRVRECVQQVTGRGDPEKHQRAFGRALGIVMAHEIYHMISGKKAHTKLGLTKESLSAHELLDGELSLPAAVRDMLSHSIAFRP
jgi:hypothetical protein